MKFAIVFLVVSAILCPLASEGRGFDGSKWITISNLMKQTYIVGYADGLRDGLSKGLYHISKNHDITQKEGQVFYDAYFKQKSLQDYIRVLDFFYKHKENRTIPLRNAMFIARAMLDGYKYDELTEEIDTNRRAFPY